MIIYQLLAFDDNTNMLSHKEFGTRDDAVKAMEQDFLHTTAADDVNEVIEKMGGADAAFSSKDGYAVLCNYLGCNYNWDIVELDLSSLQKMASKAVSTSEKDDTILFGAMQGKKISEVRNTSTFRYFLNWVNNNPTLKFPDRKRQEQLDLFRSMIRPRTTA